ncbi:iron ABC transporter permease, partial [Pseudomonas syringae]
ARGARAGGARGRAYAASRGRAARHGPVVLTARAARGTAVMVSMVGSIGFGGLVIPHAVRMLVGVRHARLVPLSALSGALFLIAADILSRTLIKRHALPIGVFTALIGAPVFAVILIRGNSTR